MSIVAVYFAYGSNLDPEQMRARCPRHRILGRAWLPGYRLCFPRRSPKRGCATAGLELCMGAGVWGALYELTRGDRAALHAFEGYRPDGPPEHNRHMVKQIEAALGGPGGDAVIAYTYLAVADDSGALPSPDYLGHLIRGGRHHGLPEDYIATLHAIATEEPAL